VWSGTLFYVKTPRERLGAVGNVEREPIEIGRTQKSPCVQKKRMIQREWESARNWRNSVRESVRMERRNGHGQG